jgi:flagellar assembly protein FliH
MSRIMDEDNENKCQRWSLPELGQSGNGYTGQMTAEELEEIQQQAYQEGFESGRRDGRDAGRQAMAEGASQLQQLMCALTRPFEDLDQVVEEELLELVFAIARQLVGNEIRENPEQIMTIVHKAVAVLPSASRNLQLHLHPEDAQLVHELLPASDSETLWHIIEDISVDRGGCRVANDTSQVDATLEVRLNNIIASLAGGESEEDAAE